ncbi:MAG: preprotein translocase subunit SecE [Phycisphaerae bacterium]|nr:preprotein translocase subunit SecE [Phycisphaerae bacterium]
MSMSIYKSGQGYWTRIMSVVGFGLLVVLGAVWLFDQIDSRGVGGVTTRYVAFGVSLAAALVGAVLIYYYCGVNQRTVDFFVATEGEMKKVNWSTRREIVGSTALVIIISATLAIVCWMLDTLWAIAMRSIGVLEVR